MGCGDSGVVLLGLEDDGQMMGHLMDETIDDVCKGGLALNVARQDVAFDVIVALAVVKFLGMEHDAVEVVGIGWGGKVDVLHRCRTVQMFEIMSAQLDGTVEGEAFTYVAAGQMKVVGTESLQ